MQQFIFWLIGMLLALTGLSIWTLFFVLYQVIKGENKVLLWLEE
jgi:hypothetical protein